MQLPSHNAISGNGVVEVVEVSSGMSCNWFGKVSCFFKQRVRIRYSTLHRIDMCEAVECPVIGLGKYHVSSSKE